MQIHSIFILIVAVAVEFFQIFASFFLENSSKPMSTDKKIKIRWKELTQWIFFSLNLCSLNRFNRIWSCRSRRATNFKFLIFCTFNSRFIQVTILLKYQLPSFSMWVFSYLDSQREGYFCNFCLPFTPASQTFRH